ncbi:MAG: hypothetical protein IPL49_14885 [Saprospirales bacterium]|nr:hypothetical protein [Saprospirales bacterium]MBK8492125.1 hypothetical protein [Saprospirales bacterium]
MTKKFNWSGFTKQERMEVIDEIEELVRGSGGWITDHQMFSNFSINITIEIPLENAKVLYLKLEKLLRMDLLKDHDDPFTLTGEEESKVFLHVHFIHEKPDLKMEIPEVPG